MAHHAGVGCSQPPGRVVPTSQVYEPPLTLAIKEIIEHIFGHTFVFRKK
jgi:hypothetical protein